ncbi:globin family protein [Anthocerotibacter panamensis]|uniref:CpcB n=1 Tax=Anthocerotibacter panamensis TaxID=2857077 RepID=A0AAJ6N6H1_9CYAN|nr:phycocyanin subunit beta [Anthocerotibacter panamensis]8IML_G Chain G, CpcB [Anthocerotibacter panamensis]8IML_H Chain H, CpcB [Anthocerotibacter panamensis]8IML_I Chain I, CpcB [Anthocerotibacter panamensis]8IML_J Chain J, CpcB [Anthocerotibacter panamensis]8IML_K Chain K, CpcB [Anthocerotibacter panamensis]8IML_L Chain L, CpcB [Anthocerotibacter panamensis]8IML_T Chain T, CpcB [Anthocerotibacter panamensis]8IML_U Chain U, CpcB [Anthocerotibacter panamensis]8IML_V Chain V, CpcB [Anthoc
MNDVFTRAIAQADLKGSFLLESDLDKLASFAKEGVKRLDAVAALTNNAPAIISDAAHKLFAEQQELIQPGGNAYPHRRMAACLRDMEIILRYVSYALLAGDASVLDDRCLNGLRETYNALGTPTQSVARAVQLMKDAAMVHLKSTANVTVGDCSSLYSEAATYFDKAAASIA